MTRAKTKQDQPTIGLAMIVRDEAAIIERCLESVRDMIDFWVIVDTGSRDGTPEIIRKCLSGVPGVMYDRSWVDFGSNRSELLTLANGSADYLLLLDADHVIETDVDWLESHSDWADVNEIKIVGPLEMWMPYFISGQGDFSFNGMTHEYLVSDPGTSKRREEKIRIVDRYDGSSRVGKWQRDEALLIKQIDREHQNSRWMFYLAQTRQGLDNVDGAIAAFRRSIELSQWDEEIYWCLLQIGELLQRRGDWPEAVIAFEAAWEYRPSRAESLFLLAAGHRERNMYFSARMFADKGLEIALSTDALFVRRWIYDWGLRFEQSVAAWWMGDDEFAVATWRDLLKRDDLDPVYREFVVANLGQLG